MVQKFTWGEIKNSHLKIHGLKIHMGLYVWACVGLFCVSVFPYQNLCKVTENKRHPLQKKIFAELFFCRIVI